MKPRRLRLMSVESGVPLAHLMRAHRQFRPRGFLPGNLGDGYLLAFNPVYRAVREAALGRGLRFSPRRGRFERDYYAFPLMSLDDAIDARRLPYHENFRWLELLEKRAPGAFTLPDLKAGELQFNYLFHESAHYVAHRELFGARSLEKEKKSARTLLAIMLGEAFANSVECLASAFAEGEIGGFFLDANCHFRANEKEMRLLHGAAARFGWEATARLLLAGFLYANYLVERLAPAEIRRVAEFAGVPAGALAARVARIGSELDEKFRTVTTPLHLRKTGFAASAIPRFLRADPLAQLLKDRELRVCAGNLAALAVRLISADRE